MTTHDDTLYTTNARICGMCLDATGKECHTPGCAFYLADTPCAGVDSLRSRIAGSGYSITSEEDAAPDTPKPAKYRITGLPCGPFPFTLSAALRAHHDTEEDARREAERHRAAVVADSPELAQARERIAALEAEAADAHERIRSAIASLTAANRLASSLLSERDAALARAAELEAAIDGPEGWRARVHALVAAAQPKPRDESVVADGGWWVFPQMHASTLEGAWRQHDRFFAPDEARIRADERARTERDIAAHCRVGAKRNEAAADRGRHGDPFFAAVLNGSVNGMNSIAEDIEQGDYPREGT